MGARYHGAGVIVSQLLKDKLIEARAHDNLEVFEAGVRFAQEIIPAPGNCNSNRGGGTL